ncbi:MAG TPA: glycosyltransferase family 2 protein [Trebonia sp.]|nr:glycosyltransferase family 2 protein [Trebonia sp.]
MTALRSSVVICAYTEDRLQHIHAAVDSVRAQRKPAAEVIVVVDNNPGLFKRLISELPEVTVVENAEAPGLSGARNTGVRQAQSDVIAFLDDDATAEPGWLEALEAAYLDPGVIGVGGLILPRWQTARPAWMPAEFYWVVGCNYEGMPTSGQRIRNPFGASMSFRRTAFELVDGFRSDIGRTASGRPLGCEETEFCIRLGQRLPQSWLVMEHDAIAHHFVPDGRCSFSYFISRCFAEGMSKAQVAEAVGSGDGLSAERGYATRVLPRGVARGIADSLHGDLSGLGRAGAIVAGLSVTAAGYVAGRMRRARG